MPDGAAAAAGAGGAVTQVVEIPISVHDIGRVIGRTGANIRCLRERSRCQVEMVASGPFVRVKGPTQGVELARLLIAEVTGGAGVVFVRDLSEAAHAELCNCGWLEKEAAAAGVKAELRGKSLLRIASRSQTVSENFKAFVERRLSGRTPLPQFLEGSPNAVNAAIAADAVQLMAEAFNLQISARRADQRGDQPLRCGVAIEGAPSAAVAEEVAGLISQHLRLLDDDQQQDVARVRVSVPIWHALLASCGPVKLNDLQADIREAVEEKYGVTTEWERKQHFVHVEGELAVEAAAELREILQYYFSENCALLSTAPASWPSLNLPPCSPDFLIQRLPTHEALWLTGRDSEFANHCERLLNAALLWQTHNAVVPLPHPKYVQLVMGKKRENACRIRNATGAVLHPVLQPHNAAAAIRIAGATPHAVEAGRRQVVALLVPPKNLLVGGAPCRSS